MAVAPAAAGNIPSRSSVPSAAHATHMPSAPAMCSEMLRPRCGRCSGNLRLARKTTGVSTAYSSQSIELKSTQCQSGETALQTILNIAVESGKQCRYQPRREDENPETRSSTRRGKHLGRIAL